MSNWIIKFMPTEIQKPITEKFIEKRSGAFLKDK